MRIHAMEKKYAYKSIINKSYMIAWLGVTEFEKSKK